MQDSSGVDEMYELQHLHSYQDRGLEGEAAFTQIEQILKRVSQKVHNHHIAITFLTDIEHIGYVYFLTNLLRFGKVDDELGLKQELRPLHTSALYF